VGFRIYGASCRGWLYYFLKNNRVDTMFETDKEDIKELTQKQLTFCLRLFETGVRGQSYMDAGYRAKNMYVASVCAARLLKNAKIQGYLQLLQGEAQDSTIMSVVERKQVLTEIARGRFSDFVEKGGGVNISPEDCKSAAIQAVRTRLELVGKDEEPALITEIRLHDPIRAIAELNKMEGLYTEPLPAGNIYNIGAINALIADPKGELIGRINRLAARISATKALEEAESGEGGEAPL
jgi:hypothetical protein